AVGGGQGRREARAAQRVLAGDEGAGRQAVQDRAARGDALDAHAAAADVQVGGQVQVAGGGGGQVAAVGQADRHLGAEVGQVDAVVVERFEEGVAARQRVLVEPGDDAAPAAAGDLTARVQVFEA